jgi:hypothetical protein
VNFYNAENNLFSPFGLWSCSITQDCVFQLNPVKFCVDGEPNQITPVELVYEGDLLTVNYGPPPCTSVAVAGFLGDESSPGRDHDGFRFDGQAGETITVTLGPSGGSGGSGGTARLVLRDGGGRRLAGESGPLPLELAATLPAAGGYVVEAREAEAGSGEPFRGHFLVTVQSNAGKARGTSLLLGPTRQSEP